MAKQCTLVDKPEDADVQMEICSGGVGTDRQDLFVGVPEIPLAPPSPIAIPKLTLFNRSKAMGTAKRARRGLRLQNPATGHELRCYTRARTDFPNWTVVAAGGVQSGSVESVLVAATGQCRSSSLTLSKPSPGQKYAVAVGQA